MEKDKDLLVKNTNKGADRVLMVKKLVCFALNISEEEYCFHQYEEGLAFIKAISETIDSDLEGRKFYPIAEILERDLLYWRWWINLCTRLDECFLEWMQTDVGKRFSDKDLLYHYYDKSTGKSLAQKDNLFADTIMSSFACLVNNVNKEAKITIH
jgi:hypothetical protein